MTQKQKHDETTAEVDVSEADAAPETADGQPDAQDPAVADLRAENADLRGQLRLNAAYAVLDRALGSAGARSPELLFDTVKGDLQFAEDGQLTNAAELVAAIKQRFPEQFRSPRTASIDGGAASPAQGALTRAALARMSPSEIASLNWDDVRRVLAG